MKQNRWLKKRFLFFAATVSLGARYFIFEYVEENPTVFSPALEGDEEPDYYGENLNHRQFSAEGVLIQELSAKQSKHYPVAAVTHFSQPHIVVTSDSGDRWQIDAQQGKTEDAKHLVTLSQQVEIQPINPQPEENLLVETEILHYHTDSQIAETQEPVKITSPNAWINSQGMSLNIPTQTMELTHQVNTRYVPPTTE